MFAGVDDESVKFVEELVVERKSGMEQLAKLFVVGFGLSEAVAFEDAAGVGVDDENRVPASIEKNGIGGFWSDAAQGKELLTKNRGRGGEEFAERAAVFTVEKPHKGLQGFCFLPEVARGAEQRGELRRACPSHGRGRKQASAAQIGNGVFDVGPGSVLREDGADDDFETSASGPPVLWAVGSEKRVEVAEQRL